MKRAKNIISLLVLVLLFSCQSTTSQEQITPEEAKSIAKEAYIYGFPMVMNYKTLSAYTLNRNSPEFKSDFNQIGCEARVYTPDDKAVVTPNSDTPYCMFWVDIRKEPQIISVPDIEGDRYYSFQLIDLYTHNHAYIGTLTQGNKAGNYLIATSDWDMEKPEGIDEVILSETDLFFVIVRTQLFDASDLENVKTIQNSFGLQSLSSFSGKASISNNEETKFPDWNEGDQFTSASLKYIDILLNLTEVHESEVELRERFKKINIGNHGEFKLSDFSKPIQEAIEAGVKEGFVEIEAFLSEHSTDPLGSAKIFGTREFLASSARENYGLDNPYLLRAVGAHQGLYGNSGFEAIYPTYLLEKPGVPFNAAENSYQITFRKGELPPVKSFWSLTMYDGSTQLLVENEIDRYLLNSEMEKDFAFNDDGSLTLYIQKDSPGEELEANWLPAPNGPFYCVLRLYGPEESALNGSWSNPPLVKSKESL